MSKTNKQKVNNTALRIITDKEKVIRKMSRFFILGICLIITFFLLMYFVINYNSNKVFIVYSESENFNINQGLLVVSRKKIYLKLGNIINKYDEPISKIEIYFKDKKIIRSLIITDDLDNVYIDLIGYDEIFNKKSINDIVNNLYVDIYLLDRIETIKLNLDLAYKNSLYVPSILDVIQIKNDIDFEIPKYVKENFKLNEAGNYEYYLKKQNMSLLYVPETLLIYINFENEKNLFYYSLDNETLQLFDNNMFVYDLKQDICLKGRCTEYYALIKKIKSNVYDKLIE